MSRDYNNRMVEESRRSIHYCGGASETVFEAMRKVDRAIFCESYDTNPVKIGHNQTCSAPGTVASMAGWLDLAPGQMVGEGGTGCGFHR